MRRYSDICLLAWLKRKWLHDWGQHVRVMKKTDRQWRENKTSCKESNLNISDYVKVILYIPLLDEPLWKLYFSLWLTLEEEEITPIRLLIWLEWTIEILAHCGKPANFKSKPTISMNILLKQFLFTPQKGVNCVIIQIQWQKYKDALK